MLGDQGMDRLVSVEEARPGHPDDLQGQRGRALATIEGVVAVPQNLPRGTLDLRYNAPFHPFLQRHLKQKPGQARVDSLSFALLRTTLICLRGTRKRKGKAGKPQIERAVTEARIVY